MLSRHGPLHMLHELGNMELILLDHFLKPLLFDFELGLELVDLFLLLVENLVLLLFTRVTLTLHVAIDFPKVVLVRFNHFFHFGGVLFELLQFDVVLFDAVLETLTSLGGWEVELVGLKLQVVLLLEQDDPLLLQMLCPLFESVLLEPRLSLSKSLIGIFKLVSGVVDIRGEHRVLLLQPLVVVSLLGVEVIKLSFVSIIDLLDLRFVGLNLIFHIPFFGEKIIQVSLLLIVLVFDVHEECLDIVWFGVTTVLVESQVIVSQLTLELPDVLDERLVPPFESQVSRVIFVDFLNLRLHLVDLTDNVIVLILEQVEVVRPIVNLSASTLFTHFHTSHSCVGDWSVNCSDFGVVTHT